MSFVWFVLGMMAGGLVSTVVLAAPILIGFGAAWKGWNDVSAVSDTSTLSTALSPASRSRYVSNCDPTPPVGAQGCVAAQVHR